MSGGGYDDDGRWVWNCTCDPSPERQHRRHCAAPDNDKSYEGPFFITMDASPPKPPYGTPERAAWDAGEQP